MTPCRFHIGEFECVVVSDGEHAFPARNAFFNAPDEELRSALHARGIEDGRVVLPFHCLVVCTGRERVLIDTGVGAGFSPATGKLAAALEQAGIEPGQIDVVLLSHGHADHAGGAVDAAGQPVFERARHVLGRTDFEFWMDPERSGIAGARGPAARKKLAALASRLELIEAGDAVVPGIRAIAAPGHTPGNFAVEIASGKERALYVADAIAHPLHLEHPDWHLEADLDPAAAVATRRRLLETAAAAKIPVCAYHMPFPAAVRVTTESDGSFKWLPLEA